MCGRFTLFKPAGRLSAACGVELDDIEPRYNIAPTQQVLAIAVFDDKRQAFLPRWGLVPSWSKDDKGAARLINARAETIAEKPSFRSAFRKRRCLVPADGFYEWKAEPGGKQPFHFRRRDRLPFAFAGLWEKGPAGDGAAILTTAANELLAPVHDRMPVILSPDDYVRWLDPSAEVGELQALMRPAKPCTVTSQADASLATRTLTPGGGSSSIRSTRSSTSIGFSKSNCKVSRLPPKTMSRRVW